MDKVADKESRELDIEEKLAGKAVYRGKQGLVESISQGGEFGKNPPNRLKKRSDSRRFERNKKQERKRAPTDLTPEEQQGLSRVRKAVDTAVGRWDRQPRERQKVS